MMFFGALLGGTTGLALIALFFLGDRVAGFPFVPFDLLDWLTRTLPGGLVTLLIDTMVSAIRTLRLGDTSEVAKSTERLLALGMVLIGCALFGAAVAGIRERSRWTGRRVGALGGLALFALVFALELNRGLGVNDWPALLWLALLIVGWGTLLGRWLEPGGPRPRAAARPEGDGVTRRALLARIAAGSVAIALAAWGAGRFLGEGRDKASGPLFRHPPGGEAGPLPLPGAPPPPGDRIEPALGTRPEVTANELFYTVDINTRPPVIDGNSWAMEVAGLFDNPRPLTLAELMAFPAVTQPITLSCISNPVGGDLIDTSYWTGARLHDVLSDLGLRPEAMAIYLVSADGFFESVGKADLLDPRTLLVYGMNGEPLPVRHGFPLRIYIPNRYGMKQPKWIRRMEATEQERPGYWVVRGWSKEAHPQIVSVIDAVATDALVEGRVPIGGIAWAGDRGIRRVEIQVDGGDWQEVTLRTPPLGLLTWVQWRHDWPTSPGRHIFGVRATDGTGAEQIERRTEPHPNGATGYHTATVTF